MAELANELLLSEEAYRKMATAVNPFGDGRASQRIVEAILSAVSKRHSSNFERFT